MLRRCCVLAAVAGWTAAAWAAPPLAEYEGFGAATQGAASSPDGYAVYRVTSLADSGAGTLRDAVSAPKRHIVFDVAGTITLTGNLFMKQSYLTVDGASAPPPGITISAAGGQTFNVEARSSLGSAHDLIFRYLRVVGAGENGTNAGDLLGLDGGEAPIFNVILDHITARDAGDGIFDLSNDVHDVTVSWCLVSNMVTCTTLTGSASKPRYNLSLHHNVWANNSDRQPRVRHNVQTLDFVNNVIYQWDYHESGYGGIAIVDDPGEPDAGVNIVNNHFHAGKGKPFKGIVYGTTTRSGPADDGGPPALVDQGTVWTGSRMGELYVTGNLLPPENYDHWSTRATPLPIPEHARVTALPAADLADLVVPHVGTHYPTPEEASLLAAIRSDIGGTEPACNTPFADMDGDEDVDQVDYGRFQLCLGDLAADGLAEECRCFDRPAAGSPLGDGIVDATDRAAFDACRTAPMVPADPDCAATVTP